MAFKNFSIWRGRLPHWRADDVRYYVTFRHRRPLDAPERQVLFKRLLAAEGRKWDLEALCVLPDATELMFVVREGRHGKPIELSSIVEAAKRKAGQKIVANTGERYPPFFAESFDRIVRDDAEFEERWLAIVESPVSAELCEDPEDYDALFVPNRG